jgi:plastocyanin/mono/diheme cytochrome c family protein
VKKYEFAARVLFGFILIGLPLLILGYQVVLRPHPNTLRTIDIRASVPESGGFQPASFTVDAGETVILRFTSSDVTHGIAIGPGLDVDLGHVDPGQTKEATLTFDHPGTYTFYCNSWCSLNHWRMRGVVEVRDPANPNAVRTPQVDPVIATLAAEGVDIDKQHNNPDSPAEPMVVFNERPSVLRGERLLPQMSIPQELSDLVWRRSHTPMQGFALLLTQNPGATEVDLRDVVAYLWTQDISTDSTTESAAFYAQNCAACHGETGGGDGFMAGQTAESPVAFSDPSYMFGARADVLYAKIRRGGMGTDMPNFGTLITPEETWALVDYLWALSFHE